MLSHVKNLILHSQSDQEISFSISTEVYPVEAVLQTAHVYTKNTYVGIEKDSKNSLQISLCYKNPKKMQDHNLAGEFMNELLNQTIRFLVNKKTRKQKEMILSHALSVNLNK